MSLNLIAASSQSISQFIFKMESAEKLENELALTLDTSMGGEYELLIPVEKMEG